MIVKKEEVVKRRVKREGNKRRGKKERYSVESNSKPHLVLEGVTGSELQCRQRINKPPQGKFSDFMLSGIVKPDVTSSTTDPRTLRLRRVAQAGTSNRVTLYAKKNRT